MAESSNIARPYARAVFGLAQQHDDLVRWNEQLDLLALIAADSGVVGLANNPRVSADQLQQVILAVAADALTEQGANLVRLLARNGRVTVLPDIARLYADLRADAERVVAATLTTAGEIDPRQREQFNEALQAKLGRKVALEFVVDPNLIGGAVVRAGDWVIDGSVRAQLDQLAGALRA